MVTSQPERHTVVWCGLASRGHILYGAAWLRSLLATGAEDVTIRLNAPRSFLGASPVTIDDVRTLVPDGLPVSMWEGESLASGGTLWCLSVGAVGIKPWLRLHAAHPGRRIPVVVTDEGLGSYGTWASRRAAWRRQNVREPWLTFRATAVTAATKALTSRRWALHIQGPDGWCLNKNIADEFRRHGTRDVPQRRAVFLSQPWPELGVMSEATYLRHVAELAETCSAVGLEFTVHPHPAEDPRRYNAWPAPTPHPLAELDADAINASVVIGASSTALVNLAAIHGTPVMRVATQELLELDRQLSPRQASLLQHHAGPNVPPEARHSILSRMLPA